MKNSLKRFERKQKSCQLHSLADQFLMLVIGEIDRTNLSLLAQLFIFICGFAKLRFKRQREIFNTPITAKS